MTIDSTFWVAVSFFLFFGGLVYLKEKKKVTEELGGRRFVLAVTFLCTTGVDT